MVYQLGLSGEELRSRLAPEVFKGVGLIRGEYLCRKVNKYVTLPECRAYIRKYLANVAALFHPDPVWYRTIDMEAPEVNGFEGVDHIVADQNSQLGSRGIRRAMLYPDTFQLELSAVAAVASAWPNVHVLIPFVSDQSEVRFVKECLAQVGFRNHLGIMAEIPSVVWSLRDFLTIGVDNVTLGMNDLSALLLAVDRWGSKRIEMLHPSVKRALEEARCVSRECSVPLAIAGHISPGVIEYARQLGYDAAVIFYSKIRETFGDSFGCLPDAENLDEITRQFEERIRQGRERVFLETWKARANE